MPLELTTENRVKEMLNSGGLNAGSALDTLIGQLITTYSAHVEKYLNRKTLSESRTQQFDIAPGQAVVALSAYPVSSVTSIKEASDRDFASVDAIDSADYYVDEDAGTIDFDSLPISGRGVLQIVWTGGLAADTASLVSSYPDIAQAVDIQIAYLLQRKDQLGSAGIGTAAGNVSWSGAVDLLPEVKRILDAHRRIAV